MALWRDPLDELIAGLERALPPVTGPEPFDMPAFEDVQVAVASVLSHSPEERARLAKDPGAQRFWAYCDRCARRQSASEPATGEAIEGVRSGGK